MAGVMNLVRMSVSVRSFLFMWPTYQACDVAAAVADMPAGHLQQPVDIPPRLLFRLWCQNAPLFDNKEYSHSSVVITLPMDGSAQRTRRLPDTIPRRQRRDPQELGAGERWGGGRERETRRGE